MRFTLGWLRDHLAGGAALDDIAARLPMLGFEVEEVVDRGKLLAPFTVAYVKKARAHPDADKLTVCTVHTGREEVEVVCGAPNARTGMKGVFAPVGTTIPGSGMELKKGKIRGVESNGMLVSEYEMGLSDDHEGIIEMPEDAPVGEPFAPLMGLDDAVIDVAVTPNRADCLGVRGIARDLAAAGLGELVPLAWAEPVAGGYESPMRWLIDLPKDKADACPFVAGRHFRGVTNGESPVWMQRRLRAIGLRPISALVDVTNYVTFDLGRPLHVFDADKVAGDLTMRMARQGEEIAALDERTYALDPETVVIADERAAHGIGGLMGGEASGVTAESRNVFLEVALFDPARIAASGRRLGIVSDARYRFERGVDPQSALWGAEVAARLILECCGGETSEVVSAGAVPEVRRELTLRPARLAELGGVDLEAEAARDILDGLGFETGAGGGAISARSPSWRADVEGEADLVEEVLRVHGYDRIPAVPLPREGALPGAAVSRLQRRGELARTALAWRGLEEAVTFSFVSRRQAELFGGVPEGLHLTNPISAELDAMRPSVLPGLVEAAARNADRGFGDLGLFEVGPRYLDDTPEGQDTAAAGVRAGRAEPRHWEAGGRTVDAFDAKTDAIAALRAAGAPVDNLQTGTDAPAWYHPGRAGALRLGGAVLAHFGELHPRVLEAYDMRGPVAAFEVYLHALPQPKARAGKARPALELPPFQPVERDFAFVVDEAVPAETVIRAARGAERKLVADVALFDVYAGERVGAGKKSLAIAVTLQPRERTLTEAEIEAVGKKIVDAVEKATGGALRG